MICGLDSQRQQWNQARLEEEPDCIPAANLCGAPFGLDAEDGVSRNVAASGDNGLVFSGEGVELGFSYYRVEDGGTMQEEADVLVAPFEYETCVFEICAAGAWRVEEWW